MPYGDLEDFLDGTDSDIPAPVVVYMKPVPYDPKVGGCQGALDTHIGYLYYRSVNFNSAMLCAQLEKASDDDLASCEGKWKPFS